jgi:hypothetical protein
MIAKKAASIVEGCGHAPEWERGPQGA